MGTGLHSDQLAHQYNAHQLPDFGFFSDDYRNNVKRALADPSRLDVEYRRDKLANSLRAGFYGHFASPSQALNYVECHDNATFYDYLTLKDKTISDSNHYATARLALQLVLLSQGIAFIHSGQEFFRTKDLIDNSYNIPDSINRLDWQRALQYSKDTDFFRQLIAFRKAHPALSLASYEEIEQATSVRWLSNQLLEYRIQTDQDQLKILVNFGRETQVYTPEKAQEDILVNYPVVSTGQPVGHITEPIILQPRQVLVVR